MRRISRIIMLIVFISFGTNHLMAQWVQTNGPEGGRIHSITEDDSFFYAGTRGPIFRMQKNDSIWNTLQPGNETFVIRARSLAISGTTIVAGIDGGGVHRSEDHGVTWAHWDTGLHQTPNVFSFAVRDKDLFAGTDSGVYRSNDHGANWTPINVGQDSLGVVSLLVKDSSLFAGTFGGGVYRSTNYGSSWAQANNGMTSNMVWSLVMLDTSIFAGTWWSEGIYRSSDDGETWKPVKKPFAWNPDVNAMAVLDTNIFAGTHGGVYLSSDRGDNWKHLDDGPGIVNCFHVSDTNIFAGTENCVYLSSDIGDSWSPVSSGLMATVINVFAHNDTFLFAGTMGNGLFRSDDDGANWVKTNLSGPTVTSLVISGTYIYAGMRDIVARSKDHGNTWTMTNVDPSGSIDKITALAVSGSNLFAGTDSNGVFLSKDDGANWTPVNSGLTDTLVRSLAVRGTNLFAGTGNGVFLSENVGGSWIPVNTGLIDTVINVIACNDPFLFAGTKNNGLFRSGDDGATWLKTNLQTSTITSLVISGTNIFAMTGGGMFLSENNGATWAPVDTGLLDLPVLALDISATNLFAGTEGYGVWQRPLSEMITSVGIDFAPDDTACLGEIIPPLIATGDSIKWYINPDFTGLLHSGNSYETGQIEPGTYTYYVTKLINSIELQDTASLIISSNPIISSIEKTNKTTCNSDDGTITITATDENDLLFSINGGNDYYENGGSFSTLSNGNYPVVVMNSNNCETSGGIIEIISESLIPPAPIAGKDTTYCTGDEIEDLYAIASSGGALTWYSDPGLTIAIGTGASFKPGSLSATTSYYVTETKNGCESPSTTVTLKIRNTGPFENEEICVINVDSISGYNIIVWEKTPDKGTATYNLYREDVLIGIKAYNELSIFEDTVANPKERPYSYYLSVVDSCGNESELSPYHKPLFLKYVNSVDGVNMIWSHYAVEGETKEFDSYAIYRGSDSLSLTPLRTNIPIVEDFYMDKDPQALENKYYYRVTGELITPCCPTEVNKNGTDSYYHAMSNLDDNRFQTFVEGISLKGGLLIYPNPTNDILMIQMQIPNSYTVELHSLSGQIIHNTELRGNSLQIDLSSFQKGVYFITIRSKNFFTTRKIIKIQ